MHLPLFRDPLWFLALMPAVPLVWFLTTRKQPTLAFPTRRGLEQAAQKSGAWQLRIPALLRALAQPLVPVALTAVLTAFAWSSRQELLHSATPKEDIRGAARLAESILPANGAMVTSGFTRREIAYYASRPVQLLTTAEESAQWLDGGQPFCYFRLYAKDVTDDLVLARFQAAGEPSRVLFGTGDVISVWCFEGGRIVRMPTPTNGSIRS